MPAVSLYELQNGYIEMQFGDNHSEIRGASRKLTINVENATFDVLQNGELSQAEELAREILDNVLN